MVLIRSIYNLFLDLGVLKIRDEFSHRATADAIMKLCPEIRQM